MLQLLWAAAAIAAMPGDLPQAAICPTGTAIDLSRLSRGDQHPVAQARTHDGDRIRVLSGAPGQAFTIVITRADGSSCELAQGSGWRALTSERNRR